MENTEKWKETITQNLQNNDLTVKEMGNRRWEVYFFKEIPRWGFKKKVSIWPTGTYIQDK